MEAAIPERRGGKNLIRGRPTPVFFFSLSLWAGLLVLQQRHGLGWVLTATGLASAGGIALLALQPQTARSWGLALVAAAAGAACSLALMAPHVPAAAAGRVFPRASSPHVGLPPEQVRSFQGTLIADSAANPGGGGSFRVALTRVWGEGGQRAAQASGQALVFSGGRERLYRGQEVRVRGSLRLAAGPGAAAFVSRVPEGAVSARGFAGPLARRRASWLSALEAGLGRLDPEVSALLAALLLGSRSGLSPQLLDQFRSSGALHLLALSGLHVGILYALLWGLLLFLPRAHLRRLAAAAGVLLYLLLVGPRPSLLRAVVMLLAAGVGAALDREADPLNLLALAAAVVLLLDPWSCLDLGCQLSFLSLAGICALSPGLSRLLRPWLPTWLRLPLALSVGAQVGSAPLLWLRFGCVYPGGVLAAVVLIPLVTALLWVGLAALPLTLVGGRLLAGVDGLLRGLLALLRLCLAAFSRIPPLSMRWPGWLWAPFAALLLAAAADLPGRLRPRRPAGSGGRPRE